MMWTMNDYDNLKTFADVIADHTQATVFGVTGIDNATQTAIVKYFQFRKVADNEKFIVFFQRYLSAHEEQYNNMLRVQTIKFDPLVTQYLERLVSRDGAHTETESRSTNRDSSYGGTNRTTGSDVTDTSASGTTNTTDTASSAQSATSKSDNTHTGSDRSMNAQLPQSSTGAGSGLPSALNWKYATSQDESANKTTDKNSGESTGEASSTGTSKGTSTNTGKTTTTHGTTVTNNNTTTDNSSESGSRSGSDSDVTKERMTGRTGDAPEMLSKAVQYISKTNAFFWLVDKLEPAFMAIYD